MILSAGLDRMLEPGTVNLYPPTWKEKLDPDLGMSLQNCNLVMLLQAMIHIKTGID